MIHFLLHHLYLLPPLSYCRKYCYLAGVGRSGLGGSEDLPNTTFHRPALPPIVRRHSWPLTFLALPMSDWLENVREGVLLQQGPLQSAQPSPGTPAYKRSCSLGIPGVSLSLMHMYTHAHIHALVRININKFHKAVVHGTSKLTQWVKPSSLSSTLEPQSGKREQTPLVTL